MERIIEKFKKAPVLYLIGLGVTIIFITGISSLLFTKSVEVNVKSGKMEELTVEEKLEDFDYACSILEDNYTYFDVKKRLFKYDWREHKDEFREWIRQTKNNAEFYDVMNKIFILLQNGHTQIISPNLYKELSDLYHSVPGGAWEEVILNKTVSKRYDYWKKAVRYRGIYIPIYFEYIEGNYIAVGSLKSEDVLKLNNIPQGSVLKKVGNSDVDSYIGTLMDKELLQYDYKRNKFKINNMIIYLKDKPSERLIFKTPEGRTIEAEIKGTEYIDISEDMEQNTPNTITSIIEKSKIAYLKVNSFEQKYIEKDKLVISDFLYSIKDYPILIIDIRGNTGGAYEYWMSNIISRLTEQVIGQEYYIGFRFGEYTKGYIDEILFNSGGTSYNKLPDNENYPPEVLDSISFFTKENITVEPDIPIGFSGKIMLLVDDNVYSAAEAFASFAKETKWATLVGTTTGGDGKGYDPAYAALPNSGLIIRFSFAMGLNKDGTANEEFHSQPDAYVEQSYNDFLKYLQDKDRMTNSLEYDTILRKAIELAK